MTTEDVRVSWTGTDGTRYSAGTGTVFYVRTTTTNKINAFSFWQSNSKAPHDEAYQAVTYLRGIDFLGVETHGRRAHPKLRLDDFRLWRGMRTTKPPKGRKPRDIGGAHISAIVKNVETNTASTALARTRKATSRDTPADRLAGLSQTRRGMSLAVSLVMTRDPGKMDG